jgi:hypothetical protein
MEEVKQYHKNLVVVVEFYDYNIWQNSSQLDVKWIGITKEVIQLLSVLMSNGKQG